MKNKNSVPFYFVPLIVLLWIQGINSASAQDKIILLNGDTLKVSLISVSTDSIHFKYYNENDSSTYRVPVKTVNKIIYNDGLEEITQHTPVKPRTFHSRSYKNIAFSDLKPITMKRNTPFYYDGRKLGRADLSHLYHSADSVELAKMYRKVIVDKSLALSMGLLAIPAAIAGVYAWTSYSIEKDPAILPTAIIFTAIYGALEAGFVYFNIQAKIDLTKSVKRYNSIIAKHDL